MHVSLFKCCGALSGTSERCTLVKRNNCTLSRRSKTENGKCCCNTKSTSSNTNTTNNYKNTSECHRKVWKTSPSGSAYYEWVAAPSNRWAPATVDKRRNWLLHLDTQAQPICAPLKLQLNSETNRQTNHQRSKQPVSQACGARGSDLAGQKPVWLRLSCAVLPTQLLIL